MRQSRSRRCDGVGGGFEDLGEAVGGIALRLAGGGGVCGLVAEMLVQAGVVDGDGGLRGEGFDERLASGLEHVRIGVAVEQAAQQLA